MEKFGRAVPLADAAPEKGGRAIDSEGDDSGSGNARQGPHGHDTRRKRKEGLGQKKAHGPDRQKNFRRKIRDVSIGEHRVLTR